MIYSLPNEILKCIYEYDDTYKEEMKYVFLHISNLNRKEHFLDGEFLMKIIDFSNDPILSTNGLHRSNTTIFNNLTMKSHSPNYLSPLYEKDPKVLTDEAIIILDDYDGMLKLLRSNLLRDYKLDGWQLAHYT